MTIYIDFSILNRMNIPCSISALFYFSDGTIVRDLDENYVLMEQQVATSKDFTPTSTDYTPHGYWLFIPYDDLHLLAGDHHLKFTVGIYDYVMREITATYSYVPFSVNVPDISTAKTGDGGLWIAGIIVAVVFVLGVIISSLNNASSAGSQTPSPQSLISPEQTIQDYYGLINKRDYNNSWSMLSENFLTDEREKRAEAFNSYTSFWDTVEKVLVEKMEIKDQMDGSATVIVTLQYFAKDGSVSYQDLSVELKNLDDKWVIDKVLVIQNR